MWNCMCICWWMSSSNPILFNILYSEQFVSCGPLVTSRALNTRWYKFAEHRITSLIIFFWYIERRFCRLPHLRALNINVLLNLKTVLNKGHVIIADTIKTSVRTAVAQWLRCCATNRKVAGSIPAGVSGVFIDIKSFRSHYGPGVDSVSNRNEYEEHFLG